MINPRRVINTEHKHTPHLIRVIKFSAGTISRIQRQSVDFPKGGEIIIDLEIKTKVKNGLNLST